MRLQALPLAILLLGLLLVPGCADTDGANGPGGDGEDGRTYEECDTLTIPFEANDTEWAAARVECEANVPGVNSQSLDCPRPAEAGLRAATNLTAGSIEILVEDAEGQRIAEHHLEDTGEQPRQLAVDEGVAGNWTLSVERLEDFEGASKTELACPQG